MHSAMFLTYLSLRSIIAVHGIETNAFRTWTAFERDDEPRGRAVNWLEDTDMLPNVIPQARIWLYDYNSDCYSDNAQTVDLLGFGESFLEILWNSSDKEIGTRQIIFIGSCFGGIVIVQVRPRVSLSPSLT